VRTIAAWVVAVLAVMGVGVAAEATAGTSPAGGPAASGPLPAEASLSGTVLVAPAGLQPGSSQSGASIAIAIVDPATGTTSFVTPFGGSTAETFSWVASGDELVAVNGLQFTAGTPQIGVAVAFSPLQLGHSRVLGRASYVVDAYRPGDVWLVVDPDYPNPARRSTGCTVEEVSLTAAVVMPVRSFPCGWTIDGPSPAGLLVTRAPVPPSGYAQAPGTLSMWDPGTDVVVSSYGQQDANVQVDGISGTTVLWNQCVRSPCGPDTATDLLGGESETLPSLPAGWNANSSYVLSPSGTYAAILAISDATEAALHSGSGAATSPPCCYYGTRPIPSELFLYDLRTGRLAEVRPVQAASDPLVRWGPTDAYLYLTLDLGRIEAVPLWSVTALVRVISVTVPSQLEARIYPTESFLPVPVPVSHG
jgi:hypothetical protein